MGLSALTGLKDIWSTDDISVGEKLTSTLMNLSMILPAVSMAVTALSNAKKILALNQLAAAGATQAEIAVQM
jgi:hypothetical protein